MKTAPADTLAHATRLFRALGDPVRLRLVSLLGEGREVCVCHLHGALELPQPTVSRHLAALRKVGLVVGRKDGLWVHYRLARPGSALHRGLLACLAAGLEDPDVLDRDRRRLERISACCDGP